MYHVLLRATCLAAKYNCFDVASMILDGSDCWSSHAIMIVIQKVLFVYLKSPSLKFVKINWDGT